MSLNEFISIMTSARVSGDYSRIASAIDSCEALGNRGMRGFADAAWLPLSGDALVKHVIEHLRVHSPTETANWLSRVYLPTQDVEIYAAFLGIDIDQTWTLANGVILEPWDSFRDSWCKQRMSAFCGIGNPDWMAWTNPIGARYRITGAGFSRQDNSPGALPRYTPFKEACAAMSFYDSPVVENWWPGFVDEEIEKVRVPTATMARYEGQKPYGSFVLTGDTVERANRVLSLPDGVREPVIVALDRLSIARRTFEPGSAAINLSIALEAVLGDRDSKSEMTHKIRTRAARLIELGADERKHVAQTVGKLYALRSAAVHGGALKDTKPNEAYALVEEGFGICVRVIEATVSCGVLSANIDFDLR